MYVNIAVIIVIIIILVISILLIFYGNQENLVNVPKLKGPVFWKKVNCNAGMNNSLMYVLDNYQLKQIQDNSDDWSLQMPCMYDEIDKEISLMQPKNQNQRFFIISNADDLIGKDLLWKHLVEYYGVNKAKTLMPMTYIVSDQHDMNLFKKDYKPNNLYILKKNIQRQTGLKITNNLDEILNASKSGYVVVQDLLQDPYTISGRKINMRVYVLVVCQYGMVDAYAYNNGFMYYTKELFKKGDSSDECNITTGYIDRNVYRVNPLTLEDFANYLEKVEGPGKSELVFSRIHNMLAEVLMSVKNIICQGGLKENITFQLFGTDVALDDKLEPKLIEINKGPDLGSKDQRDGDVKKGLMRDTFRLLGLIQDDSIHNGFVKILG